MKIIFRNFAFSLFASVAVAALCLYYKGAASLLPLLILSVIEVTFSFDNAIINAKILKKMSALWQRLFLTAGIVVAIFGMRLVFPVLIVTLTAGLGWHEVVDLALNHPQEYADQLEIAHPIITAFGGAFLMMLALHFFMEQEKEHHWFGRFERFVQRLGQWWVPTLLTLLTVGILSVVPANLHGGDTLRAGLVGIGAYLIINGITVLIGKTTKGTSALQTYVGWAAFAMFMYLELLDASFSLDGVLGAFAITNDVILIVAGLGIGAVWVRSLTVFMVRRGTLEAYKYLEHGAHYAIAVLAASMLISVLFEVPEALTGALGLLFIVGSIIASVEHRKLPAHESDPAT